MLQRSLWQTKIQEHWKKSPIVWLSGVRRTGKTTLGKSFPHARYLNCDLPSILEELKNPEFFYRSVEQPIIVFDEIHQLPDPAKILKIGADEFKHLKILATGSSTLAATSKFRDSLTNRKRTVHFLPVLAEELSTFSVIDLKKRLFYGGLPPALLADAYDPESYSEWLDSFFARDIQELFRIEKRSAFLRCLEILLRQNGGMFEASNLAKACGISRPTVLNYLEILQITHAIYVLRPFHGGGKQEILSQPKVYGFDTGFVCHALGYEQLRPEDCGLLLENLTLETLLATYPSKQIQFWRDKAQHEIDFVITQSKSRCHAIECKWNLEAFNPKNLAIFRKIYPEGNNYLVTPTAAPGSHFEKEIHNLRITVVAPQDLRQALLESVA